MRLKVEFVCCVLKKINRGGDLNCRITGTKHFCFFNLFQMSRYESFEIIRKAFFFGDSRKVIHK